VSQAAGQVALGLGSAATQSSTAFAQTANNLSDLASATTARTNLGLGTAAVAASTAFTPAASTLSISTGTTLTSASNNVTYNATSSPSITVNTGLGAGFGCAFYGAVSFSGTATLVDKRVTGVGAAICCLLSFALDSYVIVGSSS
jgi:hypothetical protein